MLNQILPQKFPYPGQLIDFPFIDGLMPALAYPLQEPEGCALDNDWDFTYHAQMVGPKEGSLMRNGVMASLRAQDEKWGLSRGLYGSTNQFFHPTMSLAVPMAIEALIWSDSTAVVQRRIFFTGFSAGDTGGIEIYTDTTENKIKVKLKRSGTGTDAERTSALLPIGTATMTLNGWNHFVFNFAEFTAGTWSLKCWKDGVYMGKVDFTAPWTPFGDTYTTSFNNVGKMGRFVVYEGMIADDSVVAGHYDYIKSTML